MAEKVDKLINEDENIKVEVETEGQTDAAPNAETDESAPVVEGEVIPPDDSDVAEKKTPSLEEELEVVRKEAVHNLDGWQRTAAELANFKRRQEEQLRHQRHQIKTEVLEDVISALDDMDLAFQNVPEDLDGQVVGWVEGFRLVQRKLHKILDDQHVVEIDTSGDFDPNLHEAVSYEASEEHDEGQIIGELRKGYQSAGRVIRPALVRVAS